MPHVFFPLHSLSVPSLEHMSDSFSHTTEPNCQTAVHLERNFESPDGSSSHVAEHFMTSLGQASKQAVVPKKRRRKKQRCTILSKHTYLLHSFITHLPQSVSYVLKIIINPLPALSLHTCYTKYIENKRKQT